MSRTPAQRGPFGNWLKESREDRYKTQAQAIAEVRRLTGLTVAPSEWAQWESGSRVPRPENPKARGLIEFFGGDPFAAYTASSPALGDTPAGLDALLAFQQQLVVAFETQAQAVMALVEEMRLSRADEVKALQEQVDFAREERRRLNERVAAIERDHAALLERVG